MARIQRIKKKTLLRLRRLRIDRLLENKRQRFILSVIFLSLGFFISEYFLGKGGLYMVITISILTDLLLFLSLKKDLEENLYPQIFILPFFYSLSFGLFYFLAPARLLTRIILTSLYAVGLYSLFLSENIFTVSSIRTIQLLGSARTVSFTITLLSYFFLSNVVFSLHTNIFITLLLVFIFSFPIVLQSIWTYTLDKRVLSHVSLAIFLSVCLFEAALVLWFWPSSPTIIALFLTGIFYSIVGLSQVWFEKRLFKGIIWEYFWVSFVIFIALVIFTPWGG
jgi:hypothetical protein